MILINFNLWRWSCACVGIDNWVILLRARYKYNNTIMYRIDYWNKFRNKSASYWSLLRKSVNFYHNSSFRSDRYKVQTAETWEVPDGLQTVQDITLGGHIKKWGGSRSTTVWTRQMESGLQHGTGSRHSPCHNKLPTAQCLFLKLPESQRCT